MIRQSFFSDLFSILYKCQSIAPNMCAGGENDSAPVGSKSRGTPGIRAKKNPASSYFPTLSCAVSSPQVLLTIVFGMGTCVSRPLLTPELK